MKYRINPKNGDSLSILGFGCMRFPKNEKEAEKIVIHAIENGVNYFDTAYLYPGSETTLGKILAKGYRDKVKIATKIPPYMVKKHEDLDKIFNKQLARLRTDRIDYYFIHMLPDVNTWNRLTDLGILRWIEEKKQNKQIINIGFSYHGNRQEFVNVVDAYDWEFCMIQYNYLDENNQAGKSGLEYAASKGLPVIAMEPLRGGKLVTKLPKEAIDVWNSAKIKNTPAEWALKWVWDHPGITILLSGMSSMEVLKENLKTAESAEANSLTENDLELFKKVRDVLNEKTKVSCTACNYCMPCPAGVDIPVCFSCYNDIVIEGKNRAKIIYLMQTSFKKKPGNASLCTKCGKCESHCPQKIAIRDELDKAAKNLEGFPFRPARFLARKFMKL